MDLPGYDSWKTQNPYDTHACDAREGDDSEEMADTERHPITTFFVIPAPPDTIPDFGSGVYDENDIPF